jgi:hypothetical protein
LPFSEGKIIPQNMEPTEILINAVGNPTVWQNGNARNCSEPFHKKQNSSEFRSEKRKHAELRNFVLTIPRKKKML